MGRRDRQPLPVRGTGAELSWAGGARPPGARGQASPCLPGPWEASGVCNREFCFFLLNITSLLTILELPRLSESRQPKGISPLTCDVKNTVISGKLRHEGRAWACVLYIDLPPVSLLMSSGQAWTSNLDTGSTWTGSEASRAVPPPHPH